MTHEIMTPIKINTPDIIPVRSSKNNSRSVDVVVCDDNGTTGASYYCFRLNMWFWYPTQRERSEKWVWYYPPVNKYDIK